MEKKYFKDLTEKDKEYLIHFYYLEDMNHEGKTSELGKKFGVSKRTIRKWWKERLGLDKKFSGLPKQLQDARERVLNKDTNIVLITAAQNKTALHEEAFSNLMAYKNYLESLGHNVELVIAPARYRNATTPEESVKSSKNGEKEDWWRDEVLPYLYYSNLEFGDSLLATSSRIRPTAKNPLTGFETMAADNHLILPHSRVHFTPLPRFRNSMLRIMSTTGFITRRNYSISKAGNIAHMHHSHGFVVVEKRRDGSCNIPRNVIMEKDGSFNDLQYRVEKSEVKIDKRLACFNWGDIHSMQLNYKNFYKTKNIIKDWKIDNQIMHDVLDGYSFNPHEKDDLYIRKKKIREGAYLIKNELDITLETIRMFKPLAKKTYVVQSNHDEFLDRLINKGDWKKDLHNSEIYLDLAKIQQTEDIEEHGCIFGCIVNTNFNDVTYLKHQDSLKIKGIEKAAHGDHGVNGSKGNYKTFSRLNTKMTHGHNHMSVIHNGVFSAGLTCRRDQYYARKGMSTWTEGHVVTFPSGKRQQWVFREDFKISYLL